MGCILELWGAPTLNTIEFYVSAFLLALGCDFSREKCRNIFIVIIKPKIQSPYFKDGTPLAQKIKQLALSTCVICLIAYQSPFH